MRWLWVIGLLAACAEPATSLDAGRASSAKACEDCHAEEAREHARSAHAGAFTSPLFAREWALAPSAFCARCHAPRVANALDEPELAARGVDCETCHLDGDTVRATRVTGTAPHPSRVDPALATTDACRGCHQVDFPSSPGQALQDTVAEWEAAGAPGGACQRCHMPRAGTRRRHDFPGARDQETLARALDVRVSAAHDGWITQVTLALEAAGAGHAVPTGDVFRRLVVRASDDAGGERAVELGRHFVFSDGAPWRPLRDDRVPAVGVREVTLRLRGRASRVRWAVEHWSVPPETAARTGLPRETLHRELARGALDVPATDGARAP